MCGDSKLKVKIRDIGGVELSGNSNWFTSWRQFFFLTNGEFEHLVNNYGCGKRAILLVNLCKSGMQHAFSTL